MRLSSCRLVGLLCDSFEGPPVLGEHCLLTAVLLPTSDNTIGVPGIDFHQPRFPPTALTADQRRARPAKEVRYEIPGLAAIDQSTFDQFYGLGSRMDAIGRRLLLLP